MTFEIYTWCYFLLIDLFLDAHDMNIVCNPFLLTLFTYLLYVLYNPSFTFAIAGNLAKFFCLLNTLIEAQKLSTESKNIDDLKKITGPFFRQLSITVL